MRKILILCILAVFVIAPFATAEQLPSRTREQMKVENPTMPDFTSRTGSCALTKFPGNIYGSFGGYPGDAYYQWLDPETDGDGNCSAPFYPFHVSSVDIALVIFGNNDADTAAQSTVSFNVNIRCPEDAASAGIPTQCKGPYGSVMGTGGMGSYSVTQFDYDSTDGIVIVNVPVDACVNGPFFVEVEFTGWDGVGTPPGIFWDIVAGPDCATWGYFDLGVGYCFLNNNTDYSCCGGATVGPWSLWANGDAGYDCAASVCEACVRTYPGDDDSDPIIIDSPSWSGTVDLCSFCSDYDQRVAIGAAGSFTGRGGDAVLRFTSIADPTCFLITLAPSESCTDFFRLRSWLLDSFGILDAGQPIYPGVGGFQRYNWSGNGDADDFGCWFPDTYTLYIDTRNCCCPVDVTFNGDNALAVEISSFAAIAGDGKVTLNWRTNAESDIDHYIIARNGEELAQVVGLGDSPTGHNYTFEDIHVENGEQYAYQLTAVAYDGTQFIYPQTQYATPQTGAGIVTEYALMQNYPNPFNPTTTIDYSVREAGSVELKVYSVDGREVATLVNGTVEAGHHTVEFDASGLASGMYLYKMTVNGFTATQKMVLMK